MGWFYLNNETFTQNWKANIFSLQEYVLKSPNSACHMLNWAIFSTYSAAKVYKIS